MRLTSAVCFVGVCLAMVAGGEAAVVLAPVIFPWGDWLSPVGTSVAILGLFGIPAAAILGWVFAPRAWSGDPSGLNHLAIRVGVLAVILGNLTFAIGGLVASVALDSPGWFGPVGGFIFTVTFLLVLLGLPAAAVTVPASATWIAVFRRVIAWSGRPTQTVEGRP